MLHVLGSYSKISSKKLKKEPAKLIEAKRNPDLAKMTSFQNNIHAYKNAYLLISQGETLMVILMRLANISKIIEVLTAVKES